MTLRAPTALACTRHDAPVEAPVTRADARGARHDTASGSRACAAALQMGAARAALLAAPVLVLLSGCAGTPPPAWAVNAHGALERSIAAQLAGHDRVAEAEWVRARHEIASTGNAALLARAELKRCAARVAALQFEPCSGFERLRADATEADRAYADHLRGVADAAGVARLPPAQQALARAGADEGAQTAALNATDDPLARLVGAAGWLQAARITPGAAALAERTASEQGWRRPLLAWLRVRQQWAERSGDAAAAQALARRIELVASDGVLPAGASR